MNRAVTAMSVHATLKDLGYKTCTKHGKKPYRWMGRPDCPKCKDRGNPNLLPRRYVLEGETPQPQQKAIRDSESRKKGGQVTSQQKKLALTEAQIIDIRNRYWTGGESIIPMGEEFGVNHTTIWHAVKGQGGYGRVEYMPDQSNRPRSNRKPNKSFTENEIRTIRRRNAQGEDYRSLAQEYDVIQETIRNMCKRRTWRNVH